MKFLTALTIYYCLLFQVRASLIDQITINVEIRTCSENLLQIFKTDKSFKIKEWSKANEIAALFCVNFYKDYNACIKNYFTKNFPVTPQQDCFYYTLGKNILNSSYFKQAGISRKNLSKPELIAKNCGRIEETIQLEFNSKATTFNPKYPLCFSEKDPDESQNILVCEMVELNIDRLDEPSRIIAFSSGIDYFLKTNNCKSIFSINK